MRVLWLPTLLLALAAPLSAQAQNGASILGGQTTAVRMTRAQALHAIERAGYGSISRLTLGSAGGWTATTSKGVVKVDASGHVARSP